MKLTKSDIAMIDELIDSRKNAIDAQSKMIVDECIKFKNNQDCNKTLIKNALVVLRSEKKIKAYHAKIDAQEKHQSSQARKNKNREKYLTAYALNDIFHEHDASNMLKMIAYSRLKNQKDKDFLIQDVQVYERNNETIYKTVYKEFVDILKVSEEIFFTENDEIYQITTKYRYESYIDKVLIYSCDFELFTHDHHR